jgi:hypothetical protein
MNEKQWEAFCSYRDNFRELCNKWSENAALLKQLQKDAADAAKTPAYPLEIPVVYNTDYDRISKNDEIKLIVIGDNPGKEEQFFKNSRYLVGQSGRIAEGFFRRNSGLGIDFRKNVIIMNKTPVHTAKTAQLKWLYKKGGAEIAAVLDESQREMARSAFMLHESLLQNCAENGFKPELWLVGYSELKEKGIFSLYRNELRASYGNSRAWDKVFVYQHFSMNRFLVDLNKRRTEFPAEGLKESLESIGKKHRDEVFTL